MPAPSDNNEEQSSNDDNDISKSAWVWSQFKAETIPSNKAEACLISSSNEEPNMTDEKLVDEKLADTTPLNFLENPKLRRGGVIAFIALASMLSTTLGLIIFLIGGFFLAWGYNPKLIEGIFKNAPGGDYLRLGLAKIEKLFS